MRPFPASFPIRRDASPRSACWTTAVPILGRPEPSHPIYEPLLHWLGLALAPVTLVQVLDVEPEGVVRAWLGAEGEGADELLAHAELGALPVRPGAAPPERPSTAEALGVDLSRVGLGAVSFHRPLCDGLFRLGLGGVGLRIRAAYASFAPDPEAIAELDARREGAGPLRAQCCSAQDGVAAAEELLGALPVTLEVRPDRALGAGERAFLEHTLARTFSDLATLGAAPAPALVSASNIRHLLEHLLHAHDARGPRRPHPRQREVSAADAPAADEPGSER